MTESSEKPTIKTRGGEDGYALRLNESKNRFEPQPDAAPYDDTDVVETVEAVTEDVESVTTDVASLEARLNDLERRYRLLLQDYIRRFGLVASLGGENVQALQQQG